EDIANDIAIDSAGNAYVTGEAASSNFPTQGPFQSSNGGGTHDIIVAKLNAAGTALVYPTFLGGGGGGNGRGIALDGSGNAYVVGSTTSASITNFAPSGSFQTTNGGGTDAVLFKLNSSGSSLTYSTFFGGSGTDTALGVAVDGSGNAYVVG